MLHQKIKELTENFAEALLQAVRTAALSEIIEIEIGKPKTIAYSKKGTKAVFVHRFPPIEKKNVRKTLAPKKPAHRRAPNP